MLLDFYREEVLVDNAAKAVHYPGTVEVNARRLIVGDGVEAGALAEGFLGVLAGAAADRFEKWMARGDPLKVVLLSGLAVGGTAWIAAG